MDNPEDAANAVATFHYEGQLPGANAKLMPELLFLTNKVMVIFRIFRSFNRWLRDGEERVLKMFGYWMFMYIWK